MLSESCLIELMRFIDGAYHSMVPVMKETLVQLHEQRGKARAAAYQHEALYASGAVTCSKKNGRGEMLQQGK